jgi:hypothetical protein
MRGEIAERRLTFADGLVSSYPLKLTQSMTVTTPSNLNPLGSSSRIRNAKVAGNAEPLQISAGFDWQDMRWAYLDSIMILSGFIFSLISSRAFSTRPTMVQHLYISIRNQVKVIDSQASVEDL